MSPDPARAADPARAVANLVQLLWLTTRTRPCPDCPAEAAPLADRCPRCVAEYRADMLADRAEDEKELRRG